MHITLIGGPADMTRVTTPEATPFWKVAEVPPPPKVFGASWPHKKPTAECRIHTYRVVRLSRDVYVGLHEDIK